MKEAGESFCQRGSLRYTQQRPATPL